MTAIKMEVTDLSVDAAIEMLERSEYVALDTETNGHDIRDGRGYLIGLSLASNFCGIDMYGYFPIRHSVGPNLDHQDVSRLREAIQNFKGTFIFHNAKFDLVSLETFGVKWEGDFYCTMIMAHLANENMPYMKDLSSVAKFYTGDDSMSKKDTPAFKKITKAVGWDVPVPIMQEYAAWDAMLTYHTFMHLKPKFDQEVNPKYWEHKKDFTRVLIELERPGVRIDQEKCLRMITIGESAMEDVVEMLGLNPGSRTDLQRLLIDELKLPVVKRSPKTQEPSFDKDAMAAYEELLEARNDDTAELILQYRGWQKTVSSNYRAYLELVSPDGRLRPNFKMHGTKTGRLACEKPNLQQIPKESVKDWNGDLKTAFVPADGFTLWEADYSQLELRLAAAYGRESELLEIFADPDRDVFTEMAGTLGMSRQDTKTLVYSIQYGGGVNRLVNVFKVTPSRAAELRDNFFNSYTGFKKTANLAKNHCINNGKVALWSGRYRHFRFRHDEAHKAFNSVMQGGAADIVEKVMVRLYKEVVDENCRMLLQVHDAVWFEIREGMEAEYHEKIRQVMVDLPEFGVVFNVDIHKIGA